jgi:hypothetical protein
VGDDPRGGRVIGGSPRDGGVHVGCVPRDGERSGAPPIALVDGCERGPRGHRRSIASGDGARLYPLDRS